MRLKWDKMSEKQKNTLWEIEIMLVMTILSFLYKMFNPLLHNAIFWHTKDI